MEIIGSNIIFKSNPETYLKEKYGKKPNTARQIKGDEWVKFQDSFKKIKSIIIVDSETGDQFERVLTDISEHYFKVFGHDDIEFWIFSWKSYKLIDN